MKTYCKRCGRTNLKLRGGFLNLIWRYLINKKPLLKCSNCKCLNHGTWLVPPKTSLIFILTLSTSFFIIFSPKKINFIDFTKSEIINVYQFIYGTNHIHKLKQHWSWIYADLHTRNIDYHTHNEKK